MWGRIFVGVTCVLGSWLLINLLIPAGWIMRVGAYPLLGGLVILGLVIGSKFKG